MESIAKSDFFFFVTTIAVVVVTLLIVVVSAYVIRIAADIKYISKRAKEETDDIADDLKIARETLKTKGKIFATIISSLFALRSRKKKQDKKN